MTQENYVLKCFSCQTFQAHLVKKAKKWECKMCGAKQSVKRHYGKGNGKDCRNQVMKLNELRLSKDNSSNHMESSDFEETFSNELNKHLVKEHAQGKPLISKWAEYLEENMEDKESESDISVADLFWEPNKKKQKVMKGIPGNDYPNVKNICGEFNGNEIPTKRCEEKNDLHSISSNKQKLQCSVKIKDCIEKQSFTEFKNELKAKKNTKEMEKKINKSDFIKKVNKSSNIFDSDPIDLDSILSF